MPRKQSSDRKPGQCRIVLNLFDGARQAVPASHELLIRLRDGGQKMHVQGFFHGPTHHFLVPFANNYRDSYTAIVSAKGYVDAGFKPVKASPKRVAFVDLMLMPKKSHFKFAEGDLAGLKPGFPKLHRVLSAGAVDEADAEKRFAAFLRDRPEVAAAFFNTATAMDGILLPKGTPLDYVQALIWANLKQDRFFAYADKILLDQVRLAEEKDVFEEIKGAGAFHPGATSSYKEQQFGEANVQLTFHEKDTASVGGVECVKLEADLDYYTDPAAHFVLEVVPNSLTKGKSKPKLLYMLRWIAGRQARVPEFNPPYTIVPDLG